MIEGLHAEPDLRDNQYQFVIARLAFRQHILENALRAFYEFDPPKTNKERVNAAASLEASLAAAEDPGQVVAFAADHPELLPQSMRKG